MRPFTKVTFLILTVFIKSFLGYAQDCQSTFELRLANINGGFFAGQSVSLKSKADGAVLSIISDAAGKAIFKLPCNNVYEMTISNYTKTLEINSENGGYTTRTLSYEANMAEKERQFAMDSSGIKQVDLTASRLPDTLIIVNAKMAQPYPADHYVKLTVTLKNIDGQPLMYEEIVISGTKRNKSVKGFSDRYGKFLVYLTKGDTYTLNFKYNKCYSSFEYPYSKGSLVSKSEYTYLGTKEIGKRKKEEALRIEEEEKRIKAEREKFEKDCKKRSISLAEGYEKELLEEHVDFQDTVISAVMQRNKWSEKLIVCDVTGSMLPYSMELSVWYQLNYLKEKNLQFVFFNDGDNMKDDKKVIGKTGGIYYSASTGTDSLNALISHVIARGYGGDCAENNMEALLKGVKLAKPFKELVAIVDNNSPVKDIELLNQFHVPVHIILCGVYDSWVMADYLLIAWKTKGSIHTIEQDITKIARMSEGQDVKIGNIVYRIMGGEFVRITKL